MRRLNTCISLPLLGPSVIFSKAMMLTSFPVTNSVRDCGLKRRSYLVMLSAKATWTVLPTRARHDRSSRSARSQDRASASSASPPPSRPPAVTTHAALPPWATRTHQRTERRVVQEANVVANVVPAQTDALALLLAKHDVLGWCTSTSPNETFHTAAPHHHIVSNGSVTRTWDPGEKKGSRRAARPRPRRSRARENAGPSGQSCCTRAGGWPRPCRA